MSKILPSEEVMEGKQKNQESEIGAVLSPPNDDHHPPHFNNDLQNEKSINSESAKDKAAAETEDQSATRKRKLQPSELKHMFPKVEDKGKRPMAESYELKPINMLTFSNLEAGGTSENELKEEDDYDYDLDLAILKAIYHYFFNHGEIPYPYTENFINYIEASIPNLKFRGMALVAKIVMLEHQFFTIMETAAVAGYYPDIIHPVFSEILHLSMGLWGNPGDYYPMHNVDVITGNKGQENEERFNQFLDEENRNEEKLQVVEKGKCPMSELYEFKDIVPTFSNLEQEAGTSENELQEDEYDYFQDLAILKSMYEYYFNHGDLFPYPITKELINYIEVLVPNLKVHGEELETKIIMLQNNFLAVTTVVVGFDPDKIPPIHREIFYLSMGLWG